MEFLPKFLSSSLKYIFFSNIFFLSADKLLSELDKSIEIKDDENLPKNEERTGSVLSPYAATKAIDEIYGWVFSNNYGMECIGLRYFNVFGPGQLSVNIASFDFERSFNR